MPGIARGTATEPVAYRLRFLYGTFFIARGGQHFGHSSAFVKPWLSRDERFLIDSFSHFCRNSTMCIYMRVKNELRNPNTFKSWRVCGLALPGITRFLVTESVVVLTLVLAWDFFSALWVSLGSSASVTSILSSTTFLQNLSCAYLRWALFPWCFFLEVLCKYMEKTRVGCEVRTPDRRPQELTRRILVHHEARSLLNHRGVP